MYQIFKRLHRSTEWIRDGEPYDNAVRAVKVALATVAHSKFRDEYSSIMVADVDAAKPEDSIIFSATFRDK